jgi:hypothetical protein
MQQDPSAMASGKAAVLPLVFRVSKKENRALREAMKSRCHVLAESFLEKRDIWRIRSNRLFGPGLASRGVSDIDPPISLPKICDERPLRSFGTWRRNSLSRYCT